MTTPTKERLAEKLADTIHEHIASALFRARSGCASSPTCASARSSRSTPTTGSSELQLRRGLPDRQDVDATLERLLELPGQLAAERKRKVALVFDEFQEVVDDRSRTCRS